MITVIGLTLIPVAIEKMGGGSATAPGFGDLTNFIISVCHDPTDRWCAIIRQRVHSIDRCADRSDPEEVSLAAF